MTIRPGIVGLGQVAWRFDEEPGRQRVWTHAGAYRAAGYLPPVAFDPDRDAREAFSCRFPDATVVASIDQFLDAEPTVVSVCTPNDRHGQSINAVLSGAAKVIWCEKPLATNLDDAKGLVEACAQQHVSLLVSHVRRWTPLWRRFKARVDSGEIGRLRSLRVAMPNRVMTIGSHAVDLLLWIGGPVRSLQTLAISGLEEEGEPAVAGLFAFESGTVGHLQVTGLKVNLIVEAEAIGDRGRLSVCEGTGEIRSQVFRPSARYSGYSEPGEAVTETVEDRGRHSPFTDIAEEVRDILNGSRATPTCSGSDALQTQEVLEQLMAAPNHNSGAPKQ